jgi:hypothetical protein
MGAVVALAAVVGLGGIAGSQGGSDDFVVWKTGFSSSSKYFQFDNDSSQRQKYTNHSPWELAATPALMEVSAQNGTPYHSLLTLRHGVKSSGSHGDDSIGGSEVLVLSSGSDLLPRRFSHITDLKISTDGSAATARLTAKRNGEVVGSQVVSVGKWSFKIFDFDVDASFDTLEFSSDSGKYGVWALATPKFHLTSAQVVAPGQPVVSENGDGDTAETTCLGESGCDAKGGEVPIVQAFGEDDRKFLDVIFVGEGGTVFLQTVLTYTLDPVPAQLPVSEIDFDPSDDGPFEPVTLCDALDAGGPTTGPITATAKPACLRSLVATSNGDGTMTVVETYELAGDPRVRFA